MNENVPLPDPQRPFWEYVPEIYHDDALLSAFVAILERQYLTLEQFIDTLPQQVYHPSYTPDSLLDFVGRMVGLQNDNHLFSKEQMRALIPAAFRIQSWKGTRAALYEMLRFYLSSLRGRQGAAAPSIVEYDDFSRCCTSRESLDAFIRFYGGASDITVILPPEPRPRLRSGDAAKPAAQQEERARIRQLVDEYTPATIHANICFSNDTPLDGVFLGYNTIL